jgi:hypothetical protein
MAPVDHRHLPADLIDHLLAGALPSDEVAAVERAEQDCDLCRQRLAEARQAGALFLTRNPPPLRARELLDQVRGRRRRRIFAWVVPALSAAALAIFVLWRPALIVDDVIAKGGGGPALGFSVQRAGAAPRPGRSGEALRPGDTLQLQLQTGRFRAAHVFSLDAGGRARPLFDWSPDGPPPPALVLDGTAAAERIVALFHDLPATELARLRKVIAAGYTDVEGAPAAPSPAVVIRSILVRTVNGVPSADRPDVSRP